VFFYTNLFVLALAVVVQVLLARRLDALKRVGRALTAPRIFNQRTNWAAWAFLLGGDHNSIEDRAVTFYVWTWRLLMAGWFVLFAGNFAGAWR
jgi:hypothetical protein